MTHRPCAALNNHYGAWIKVKKPFPWGLFFEYYELHTGTATYFERKNKLDSIFNWVSMRLENK